LADNTPDEEWNLGWLYHELTNHRIEEHTISYVESHDQALVGGKTFIFELIDSAMYDSMRVDQHNLVVDRGIALHKMARLATAGTAIDGYLNFMGNEFGHPEWIDFPREGNGWSYHYARRRWSLRDDPELKFHYLADFDRAMIHLLSTPSESKLVQLLHLHEADKTWAFEHNGLIFCFNFHPTKAVVDYPVKAPKGKYQIALNTDDPAFGGFDLIEKDQTFCTLPDSEKMHRILLYLPPRTAIVLKPVTEKSPEK
jgi:1,4-alpha-glucan branching enzyme